MKNPARQVPRMDEDAITELARKMYRHEVYLVWSTEPFVFDVFPVLRWAAADMRKDYLESIGAVYSTPDRTGGMVPGRALNGRPIFFCCSLVNVKDCDALWAEYERIGELVGTPLGRG